MLYKKPATTLLHEANYQVRASEIGPGQRMRPDALLLLFHETAMQHVIKLGISLWDMANRNLTWVLLEQRLEILRRPKVAERVRVFTGPAGFDRLYIFRDYRMVDEQDQLIAWSSSKWILMHRETRRPQRLTAEVLALASGLPPKADQLPRPVSLPGWPTNGLTGVHEQVVQFSDLDFNHHLNNAAYVRWMLNGLSETVLTDKQSLHLRYGHEVRYGQWARVEVVPLDTGGIRARLVSSDDTKTHAEAWIR